MEASSAKQRSAASVSDIAPMGRLQALDMPRQDEDKEEDETQDKDPPSGREFVLHLKRTVNAFHVFVALPCGPLVYGSIASK